MVKKKKKKINFKKKSDGNAEFDYLWERSDGGRSARYACGARREWGDVLESGKCMNDRSVAPWRRLYRRLQQHHRRPPARSLRAPFSARSCHRLQTDSNNQLGLISNSSQGVFWATFLFPKRISLFFVGWDHIYTQKSAFSLHVARQSWNAHPWVSPNLRHTSQSTCLPSLLSAAFFGEAMAFKWLLINNCSLHCAANYGHKRSSNNVHDMQR